MKSYGRLNWWWASFFNNEHLNISYTSIGHPSQKLWPESSSLQSECHHRFLTICEDPKERLWSFVFVMGFIFQKRASQYIINNNQTCVSIVGRPNLRGHCISTFKHYDILWCAQLDIWVKKFARRNLPESSLLKSECLNRFPSLCVQPEERLWPFLFAMGFIFQQRAS